MLLQLLINALAIFISVRILPGVHLDSFVTAIIVTVILTVLNIILKPILLLLTLPLTIITLGLFYFILNGVMVLIADALITGFQVDGLLWAIIFSLVVSLINTVLNSLTQNTGSNPL